MNRNILAYLSIFLIVIAGGIFFMKEPNKNIIDSVNKMEGTVLSVSGTDLTVQDNENIIYTLEIKDTNVNIGDHILIEYTGLLNKNKEKQDIKVTNYSTNKVSQDDYDTSQTDWDSNGMFRQFYTLANSKLETLTLDEKIGQLFLVRYPDKNQIDLVNKYNFAGYIFYEDDFTDKTKYEVVAMMDELQTSAKIPLLTAVDEEGGNVVRVSSNPNLVNAKFLSPSELYKEGGFDVIREDTINKSGVLNSLGINLNLAPVVDVVTDSDSYMYDRSLQQNTELTSTYAKTVIEASKNSQVSYTLKHFPGYGNNGDTHVGTSTDTRSYDDIYDNDLPPFKAGIEVGAEAILVSHNIVTSIDDINPASLSISTHNLLRNDLGFTGIIIADDLAMGAVSNIDNTVIKAVLAGNDLIIVTDYEEAFNQVKEAVNDGTISEDLINKLAGRIIAWKYYKGLMYENQK